MPKNKVIVLTHTADDYGVLSVMEAIRQQGGIPIRFNCDEFPGSNQLSVSFIDGKWKKQLFDGKDWHNIEEINAVWFRRAINIGNIMAANLEDRYKSAAVKEATRAFNNFFSSLDETLLLNSPFMQNRFYSKEYQLELASSLGLRIPETCICNSPTQLKELIDKYPNGILAKPHSSYFIDYEKIPKATLFASVLSPEEMADLDGLEYSPMIFQEPIPKKVELRIPVVGNQLWAYSIDSQSNKNATEDWRKAGLEMIEQWQPYEISAALRAQLLAFTKKMGCIYGSFDIIVTPEEEYVFLEINSDGEFFWLDQLSNYQISNAFAKTLLAQ